MKKVTMFPGQGSQYKGMGKDLFSIYKDQTVRASEILGYDIKELCLQDPKRNLGKTQYTQPALYTVNAFRYYEQQNNNDPDYLIGHSLGEYNALLVSGAFDFETGLKIVQKRGELMAAASGGSMAAVLGLDILTLTDKLEKGGYKDIDIANYNTPTQVVISGPKDAINEVVKDFDKQEIKIIPLFVTAPFHSRYMKSAAIEFTDFLSNFNFSTLKIPVISNTTATPYDNNDILNLLSKQIVNPVRWVDSIRLLMGKDATNYQEIGSDILSKMVKEIRENTTPLYEEKGYENTKTHNSIPKDALIVRSIGNKISYQEDVHLVTFLGSESFRKAYNIKYAYLTGSMYRGIASKELVVLMGRAKMMGFLGTGGMTLEEIEKNIIYIQNELTRRESYGFNLLHNFINREAEMNIVKLYVKYNIKNIEAAAFVQITLPLVYYRLKGLRKDSDGTIICEHKIVAKVSQPEVAEAFMRPAPKRLVDKLIDQGLITEEQGKLSKMVPMSNDICVEADSGGHTDAGIALVLLPSIQQLKKEIEKEFFYTIHVGLAGGIGTPQAAACAFTMGADFIVTGSINQCTVEAGISDAVKDLLQEINVQDTAYVPAGDMFEIGGKAQVLKKGVLFPIRANKLHAYYKKYDALDEIPKKTIEQLENSYFKKSIAEVWEETKVYLIKQGENSLIKEAEENPKKKMALVFQWYFGYSSRLAFAGEIKEKSNFQIHTGPSLGAFNQWVKGTELESWKNRHSDVIGIKIMEGASEIMRNKLLKFEKLNID